MSLKKRKSKDMLPNPVNISKIILLRASPSIPISLHFLLLYSFLLQRTLPILCAEGLYHGRRKRQPKNSSTTTVRSYCSSITVVDVQTAQHRSEFIPFLLLPLSATNPRTDNEKYQRDIYIYHTHVGLTDEVNEGLEPRSEHSLFTME